MSFPQHFSAQFLQKYTRIFLFTGWKTANKVHTAHRTESNRPGQRSIPGREQLFGASRASRCCFVLRSLSLSRALFSPVFRTTPTSTQYALLYLDVFLGEIFPHQATAKSRLFFLLFSQGDEFFLYYTASASNVCVWRWWWLVLFLFCLCCFFLLPNQTIFFLPSLFFCFADFDCGWRKNRPLDSNIQ